MAAHWGPAGAPPGVEQDGLLTKGVLAQWQPGCVRVPYAYGVLLDGDGGQHLFARDHLGPGLLASLLAEVGHARG
ncbi:unnamed protein product [Prorocentrum cordatum]|uniref:Uncharacterized protein n=1 Tax=Prorocentrum cordatum TaxID=2364126 RepID=A0ABN9QXI1_9DINO|nr:unnamed protein product [Polarella glacialis]